MKSISSHLIVLTILVLSSPSARAQNSTSEAEYLYFEAMDLYRQDMEKEALSHPLAENYYTQFRGINCCGTAPAGATPPQSPNPNQNLAWKSEIATGVSSPCVWENSIFLTGYNPYDRLLITYGIDKKKGTVLWEHSILPDSIEPVHPVGSPAAATPVSDGKHVIVYFGSYGIVCYDMKGNLIWEKKMPVPKTRYGSCTSPVILKDKLILNRFEVNNPVVYALKPETGEIIWEIKLSTIPGLAEMLQRSQSTPVLWNDEIILHRSLELVSVDLNDGKEKWTIPLVSMGTSTPVIHNHFLYINGYSNLGEARLYDELPEYSSILSKYDINNDSLVQFQEMPESLAFFRRPELDLPYSYDTLFSWRFMAPQFDLSKDNALNLQEWTGMKQFWSVYYTEHGVVAIDLNKAGNPDSSEYLWKETNYIAEVPSLLVDEKRVYMIANGGILSCMNKANGQVIFRERINAPGAYIASPLMANGNIYLASYNGKITVVAPGDSLQIISQCDLKEKIAASPVAVDNQLLVRTDKGLYSFSNH